MLDIQSNLLDEMRTTVVIPLSLLSVIGGKPISRLCPIVKIEDEKYVVLTQLLAGVDRKILGPKITDLTCYRADIITAIDFVISGI